MIKVAGVERLEKPSQYQAKPLNHRDPTLVTNVYSEKQTFILFSEEFVIRQEGSN